MGVKWLNGQNGLLSCEIRENVESLLGRSQRRGDLQQDENGAQLFLFDSLDTGLEAHPFPCFLCNQRRWPLAWGSTPTLLVCQSASLFARRPRIQQLLALLSCSDTTQPYNTAYFMVSPPCNFVPAWATPSISKPSSAF